MKKFLDAVSNSLKYVTIGAGLLLALGEAFKKFIEVFNMHVKTESNPNEQVQ